MSVMLVVCRVPEFWPQTSFGRFVIAVPRAAESRLEPRSPLNLFLSPYFHVKCDCATERGLSELEVYFESSSALFTTSTPFRRVMSGSQSTDIPIFKDPQGHALRFFLDVSNIEDGSKLIRSIKVCGL